MTVRIKYILFVVIIHSITIVLSFFLFEDNRLFFIISELFIFLSILFAWQLYRELIQPLNMLMSGTDAIRDRDFNIKFVHTGKYEMDKLISVYNQMIDELRNERTQQQEQHFFLSKLIQTSPTGIIILDYDEKINEVNPKAAELLRMDEKQLKGKPLHYPDHPVVSEISKLQTGQSATVSINGIETYKIQKSHFIDRGFNRYFVMIEELTTEILAAEKRAYGKIIRMMAHEVNNTIGPVNSIIDSTLQHRQAESPIAGSEIEKALKVAMKRNDNLNTFMRNFADIVRLPHPVKVRFDLHTITRDVARLMEQKGSEKKIEFNYQFSPGVFEIFADQLQMEQVLINIIRNSMDAIGENGSITFESHRNPASFIIRDTGHGIPRELEDQLFTAFFSTKKDGQGIGLTLSRDILLNHGFGFSLKTIERGRTEFRILF